MLTALQAEQHLNSRPMHQGAYVTLLSVGVWLIPFSTAPGDGSIVVAFGLPVLLVLATYCTVVMLLRVFRLPRQFQVPALLALLYCGSIVLFSLIASQPLVSLWRAATNVLGFVIFLFALHLCSYSPYSGNLGACMARVLAVSGLILSVYYITNIVVVAHEYGLLAIFSERFVGGASALPWGATNSIASCLLITYIAAFLCTLDTRYRWIGYTSLLLTAVAILITVSRNAILVLVFISLMWGVVLGRPKIVLMVPVLCGGLLLGIHSYDPDILSFLYDTRLDDPSNLSTLNSRTEIWEDRIEYFLRNPFSPVGYFGSLKAFDGVSAHNSLLTALLEQTALGLLLFLGVFVLGAFHLLRKLHMASPASRKTRLALSVGLTGILINLQFEDANFTQPYLIYFWIFMALVFLSANQIRKSPLHS